jgi:hypothetical protein
LSYLHCLEVSQQLVVFEVSAAKEHVQVACLVQPVLNFATLEVLHSLQQQGGSSSSSSSSSTGRGARQHVTPVSTATSLETKVRCDARVQLNKKLH